MSVSFHMPGEPPGAVWEGMTTHDLRHCAGCAIKIRIILYARAGAEIQEMVARVARWRKIAHSMSCVT
jgi:hypothetical protein